MRGREIFRLFAVYVLKLLLKSERQAVSGEQFFYSYNCSPLTAHRLLLCQFHFTPEFRSVFGELAEERREMALILKARAQRYFGDRQIAAR